MRDIAQIYLQHIEDAQLSNGRFHNFKDKHGKFLDEEGSQDAFGRAVWALGVAQKSTLVDKSRARAAFDRALPHVTSLDFPRSVAFTLLGVQAVGRADLVLTLGKQLARIYEKCAREDWQWFETCIRYSNGILPYSLLLTGDAKLEKVGLTSLQFLNEVSRVDGVPSPIGNKGWYCYGGKRAIFDQQCIDAADMVLANLAAYEKTGETKFLREASDWLRWFYGYNIRNVVMVTQEGGCYNAITGRRARHSSEDTINTSQGAESVLAYLLAYLALAKYAKRVKISPLS